MTNLQRRSILFGLFGAAAAGVGAAVLPTAALALPLAGGKPLTLGDAPPSLEELAQVVVVRPRPRHRRRYRRRHRRRVCWWHRGRRVCGWR